MDDIDVTNTQDSIEKLTRSLKNKAKQKTASVIQK